MADIVAAWRVSKPTVLRLIWSGELPATKIGGQWRIKESDAKAYLAERASI